MKNSSKKNFSENNYAHKKNLDFSPNKEKTNRLKKNERFLSKSAKNKNVENFNKNDKTNAFSSSKRRNPRFKSNIEFV